MKVFQISYDLRSPGQDYATIIATLERWGAVKVLLSDWIFVSNASAAEIRDTLTPLIDANDGLLVVGLTGDAAWRGLLCTHDALQAKFAS